MHAPHNTRTKSSGGSLVGSSAVLPFDPDDPVFMADPGTEFARLHRGGPIQRTAYGVLFVVGHPEICEALRDPNLVPHDGMRSRGRLSEFLSLLFLDGADHARLRGLVRQAFTARAVAAVAPRIAAHVTDLVDGIPGGAGVDLMDAVAYPLALRSVAEILGTPLRDVGLLREWAGALSRGMDPEFCLGKAERAARDAAGEAGLEYFTGMARRACHPEGSLLDRLVREHRRSGLTMNELGALCLTLVSAGSETVTGVIGHGLLGLTRDPERMAALARSVTDDGIASAFVEEVLRFQTPPQCSFRIARAATQIGDHKVRRGEPVLLLYGAGNRDPRLYANPECFDPQRVSKPHLAFGAGPHFCLGALLARLECSLVLPALARRHPRLVGEPVVHRGVVMSVITELPVTFDAPGTSAPALGGAPGARTPAHCPGGGQDPESSVI